MVSSRLFLYTTITYSVSVLYYQNNLLITLSDLLLENLKIVRSWYVTSFLQLRAFPIPNNAEREKEFAKLLEDIYERHAHTLITMARAAHEIRTMMNSNVDEFAELAEVQRRLDKFYLSRIGIRMVGYPL